MTIYVPGGIILTFMSLYIFREYHRVKRAKQEERRENLHSIRQEYLDSLIRSKNKELNKPDNNAKEPDDT